MAKGNKVISNRRETRRSISSQQSMQAAPNSTRQAPASQSAAEQPHSTKIYSFYSLSCTHTLTKRKIEIFKENESLA